jgi:hypothetical protein
MRIDQGRISRLDDRPGRVRPAFLLAVTSAIAMPTSILAQSRAEAPSVQAVPHSGAPKVDHGPRSDYVSGSVDLARCKVFAALCGTKYVAE